MNEDDRFWCAFCDEIKPMGERSSLTNMIGLTFCQTCKDEMERHPEKIPMEWRRPA